MFLFHRLRGTVLHRCSVYSVLYSAERICLWSHCSMEANLCKENGNRILPFRNIYFWQGCCFFIPLLAEEILQSFLEGEWLCGSAPLEKVIACLYFFLSKDSSFLAISFREFWCCQELLPSMCGVLILTPCFYKFINFLKKIPFEVTRIFKKAGFCKYWLFTWLKKILFTISKCQFFNTHWVWNNGLQVGNVLK